MNLMKFDEILCVCINAFFPKRPIALIIFSKNFVTTESLITIDKEKYLG